MLRDFLDLCKLQTSRIWNLLLIVLLIHCSYALTSTDLDTVAEGLLGVFVCLRCLQLFACVSHQLHFLSQLLHTLLTFVWLCRKHL